MTSSFVNELRVGDQVVVIPGDGVTLHIRVQAAELWEMLRVDAPASASISTVKDAVLSVFFPNGVNPDEFVAKVKGFEILRENESLDACGVRDGSTILLTSRRRRPVK